MRILLTGASGFLGEYLISEGIKRGLNVVCAGRKRVEKADWEYLDLSQEKETRKLINKIKPNWIIHAGAVSSIEQCEKNNEYAIKVNAVSTKVLSQEASSLGCKFMFVSTDMVFDGKNPPYYPEAKKCPVSQYGYTKALGEDYTSKGEGDWYIARLALLYGRSWDGKKGASDWLISSNRDKREVVLFKDEFRSPVWVKEVSYALYEILEKAPSRSIWHIGGPKRLSRFDFGILVAKICDLDRKLIKPGYLKDYPKSTLRPPDLTLVSEKTEKITGFTFKPPENALEEIY